jgi:hypothetical protein
MPFACSHGCFTKEWIDVEDDAIVRRRAVHHCHSRQCQQRQVALEVRDMLGRRIMPQLRLG